MLCYVGNFLRRLALPKQVKDCPLRTVREKLVKIGAKVVSHAPICDIPDWQKSSLIACRLARYWIISTDCGI